MIPTLFRAVGNNVSLTKVKYHFPLNNSHIVIHGFHLNIPLSNKDSAEESVQTVILS